MSTNDFITKSTIGSSASLSPLGDLHPDTMNRVEHQKQNKQANGGLKQQ